MQTTISRLHSPEKAKAYFENKLAFTTGPVELDRWIKNSENNLVVVDVRAAEDYAKGHICGAINIPKEQWDNPGGLSRDKTNVVYCYTQQCHLAANACVQFAGKGYQPEPSQVAVDHRPGIQENDLDIEEESANRFKQQTGNRLAGRR